MDYKIEYIEKIAKIITENNLSEITLEDGEKAISIRKESICQTPIAQPIQTNIQPSAPISAIQSIQPKEENVSKPKGNAITSPMVGAFYAAPSPGAKPFVKVGDSVSAGQVVCIIEAMKLMNEIESEFSGKVTQICVEDGQSVEYGQVLMYVE